MRRKAFLFLIPATLLVCVADLSLARNRLPDTSDILDDIQLVKSEKIAIQRALASERLKEDLDILWKQHALETVGDDVIDGLIALLNDDDDGVRQVAAGGIGGFGIRARRAEPALNCALERIKKERAESNVPFSGGGDSLSAILFALDRIHGVTAR